MGYPVFASGDVLNASDMNAVGLWLVKSQAVGSAVSSVTVTGAFSSSFDNYLITLSGGTASADSAIALKLGASTTGYYGVLIFTNTTTPSATAAADNNGGTFTFVGGAASDQNAHVSVNLFNPFQAAYTKCRNGSYQNGNNYGAYNGEHRVATSYTDFTLVPGSGTLTGGTIRVYGYRN